MSAGLTGFAAVSVLGFGLVTGACALALLRLRAPRALVLLMAGGGLLCVAAAAAQPSAADLAQRLLYGGTFVLLPMVLVLFPDGRHPPRLGWPATAAQAAAGAIVIVYPRNAEGYALGGACLLGCLLWWRFECAGTADRLALLWLTLIGGTGVLAAGFASFLYPHQAGAVVATAATAAVPVAVVVGLRPPDVDVRSVITRTVVEAAAMIAVVALFVGAVSTLELVNDRTPGTGALAVLAAVCAAGYHPVRVQLLAVVDRLIFGDREGPVAAASHVGRTLGEPVLALRALRESLALPYAALVTEAGPLASSGQPTTSVHSLDLLLGDQPVGRLDVGLRPGELRLSRHDRTVLQVVVPALAQAVHAQALTRQLQDSRAGVITAVEDERRRLRHDLHDSVGPTLTGIAFAADAARNTLGSDPDRAGVLLGLLRTDAADALAEVRRVVEGLRPPAVDELGLVGALRQHVAAMPGLAVHLQAGELPRLPAAVEVAAYRIVTEALTNVRRHAGCDAASVCLSSHGGALVLEVRDTGGRTESWEPGVGLTSMRERAEQLGGTFTAGAGVVHAELPLGAVP